MRHFFVVKWRDRSALCDSDMRAARSIAAHRVMRVTSLRQCNEWSGLRTGNVHGQQFGIRRSPSGSNWFGLCGFAVGGGVRSPASDLGLRHQHATYRRAAVGCRSHLGSGAAGTAARHASDLQRGTRRPCALQCLHRHRADADRCGQAARLCALDQCQPHGWQDLDAAMW